jgi:hypothetical protein
VQLTTTQVSLIAALIALEAPAITYRASVRVLYADLISLVREELKQDRDPWWRRTRRAA